VAKRNFVCLFYQQKVNCFGKKHFDITHQQVNLPSLLFPAGMRPTRQLEKVREAPYGGSDNEAEHCDKIDGLNPFPLILKKSNFG
jgi:hypothetical protein